MFPNLTPDQRRFRSNVRNFLMVASPRELEVELALSLERGDHFRADCVRELIAETNIAIVAIADDMNSIRVRFDDNPQPTEPVEIVDFACNIPDSDIADLPHSDMDALLDAAFHSMFGFGTD